VRKNLLIRGPALSRSGYGEQTRFALNALRAYSDIYEIYLQNIAWGQTGHINEDTEEKQWIEGLLLKTAMYKQQGGTYDVSLQVTIPNEWKHLAPINIGYTAGIETTKVAPDWLEKGNMMDKVIVVSNHSKEVFEETVYSAVHPDKSEKMVILKLETPVDVINYAVRKNEPADLNLELDYDFNFLCMAQWGPRKNLKNTIKWFMEENFDQEVGLVVKTFLRNNSFIDREHVNNALRQILNEFEDSKCKIYLLHGDMSQEELAGLYTHPKIKAMVTATHGEGFGLPLFEAACHGLPVIAPGWSGQRDFLYMPDPKRKKAGKKRAMFAEVKYDLKPVQKAAHWEGVIQEDSDWCYPQESSFKRRLREVITRYPQFKGNATKLQKWILEEFSEGKQYDAFYESIAKETISATFYEDALKDVVIQTLKL
jgi:hypothetical protein